jgi:ornithine cyclodeaminase/alanine dehydrogenase-like protein (mu-crystallin family)
VAAILGSGTLARTHLLAMCEARPIERVRVYSRDAEHVAKFISEMHSSVGAALVAAPSSAEAVRDADVICAVTTSKTPVLDGHNLKPGAHVNGVGSFTLGMQEIDPETIRRAGQAFVDSIPAIMAESGELAAALNAGIIAESDLIEIGNVAAGRHPGRESADQITFFKSVGIAVQDVAAGGEVLRRAKELGLGTTVYL